MPINRQIYFKVAKPIFGGSYKQEQVDGQNALLDAWDRWGDEDIRKLAYILATFFHETARWMIPVIETRRPDEPKNPSVDTAIARLENSWSKGKLSWVKKPYWRKDADGLSWLGRGGPQVTHKENYLKAEKLTGIQFSRNPDMMLKPDISAQVAVKLMLIGTFTGKKLSDYFNAKTDWVGARRVINGTDKATTIAGYAKQFYNALLAATDEKTFDVMPIAAIQPEPPPPPSLAKSPVAWTLGAGGAVPGAIEIVRNITEQANSTTATITDAVGNVKETVTTVKDNVDTVSGYFNWMLSPTVMIGISVVSLVAIGLALYWHHRAVKAATAQ